MEMCPRPSVASLPAAAEAGAWWEIKGAGKAATWGSVQLGGCGDGTLPQVPEPNLRSSQSCLGMPPAEHSPSAGWKLRHLVPKSHSLLGKNQHRVWSKISQSKQEGKQLPRSTDLSAV